MIKQYQNKEWLREKYWEEKLSLSQIGKLCDVTLENILYWMKKFDILRRSLSKGNHLARGNHCQLSQKAIEWIQGELLGDGCLISSSPYSAYFSYHSKYFEYAQYVSDTLKSFGIKQIGKINKYYHKKLNCYSYAYCSHHYVELLSLYKRWYPEGKKIISKDLELTPLILRQHFIGDGSLIHPKNYNPSIRLATCGFSIFDVEWLIKKLNKLGFKTTRQPAMNTIYISTHSTKDFLKYIGNSPVRCYDYKFNY